MSSGQDLSAMVLKLAAAGRHVFTDQLGVVLTVSGRLSVQARSWRAPQCAEAGSLLLVSSECGVELCASTDSELRCFGFSSGSASAERLSPLVPRARLITRCEAARSEPLTGVSRLLIAEAEAPAQSAARAACLLEALLVTAAENDGSAPAPVDAHVARALELLQTDLARPWSVPALARAVGLSRSALSRRFRAVTGQPPERALTKLRLERAAQLLTLTDRGLAEIAASVGYGSEFALSRAFKRWFGMAPSVYRHSASRSGTAPVCLAA